MKGNRGSSTAAAAGVSAGGHVCAGHADQACQSPSRSVEPGWGAEGSCAGPEDCSAEQVPRREWGQGSLAPGGDWAQRAGARGKRPHVRERQVRGGGACTPVGARVCAHTDTRGRRHRAGGREAGARAEDTAAHRALAPAPTLKPPPPVSQDSAGRYLSPLSTPFSSCCWGTCCRGGGWL